MTVTSGEPGQYHAITSLQKSGLYALSILLNDVELEGSPVSVEILPGPFDASLSSASGTGLSECIAGEVATFTIKSRDVHGNDMVAGGCGVSLRWDDEASDSPVVEIVDTGVGAYRCNYTRKKAGPVKLHVLIHGQPIAASPFDVLCRPGLADAASSIILDGGVSSCVAGIDSQFLVESRDKFGNRLTRGGEAISVLISGASSPVTTVVDRGNGQYVCSFRAFKAGPHLVTALLGKDVVASAGFECLVSAAYPAVARASRSLDHPPIHPSTHPSIHPLSIFLSWTMYYAWNGVIWLPWTRD